MAIMEKHDRKTGRKTECKMSFSFYKNQGLEC